MTCNPAILLLLGLLPACATPLQQCINQVSAEYLEVSAQIVETRANIERGYALHVQTVPFRPNDCYFNRWGNNNRDPFDDYWDTFFDCSTRLTTITIPVAVDMNDQRQRLRALEARLPELAGPTRDGVAMCRQQFPQ